MKAPSHSVYQLRVTLIGSAPPIWRQILVPGSVTLQRLHMVLQKAMGWETSHLHMFEVGENRYGDPDPEWPDVQDHRGVRLYQAAQEGGRFIYDYDMGDGWRHAVAVERAYADKTFTGAPTCLAGERACPPEDCGGIGGYAELLKTLADRRHPEHRRMKEWMGGPFDPEAFDLAATNRRLWFLAPRKARIAQVEEELHSKPRRLGLH
jgi:hypothetical protein